MKKPSTVSCLYVREDTIYRSFPGTDCWPRSRDATQYAGPGPIIAHPPCGHWGSYAHMCLQDGQYCGPVAVHQAQKFGGVVEHPATSQLFRICCLTRGVMDVRGGRLVRVNQCDFGHDALKPTLLYVVRCIIPKLPKPRKPKRPMEDMSRRQRESTPPDFAAFLLELARSAGPA